jgi:hypothetical protein
MKTTWKTERQGWIGTKYSGNKKQAENGQRPLRMEATVHSGLWHLKRDTMQ